MTETVGKSSDVVEGPPPWERVWNSAKTFVGEALTPDKGTGNPPPWERFWGGEKKAPTSSGKITQAPDKFESVFSSLIQAESRGKHFTDGKLTQSGAGAQGITQLMPKTAADPGYGVEPIKDKSEKEYLRFGREYLGAMLKEFNGDYEKALAAYNAGAGNVKKAITKGGDSWKDHLPKPSETLPYIKKILKGN